MGLRRTRCCASGILAAVLQCRSLYVSTALLVVNNVQHHDAWRSSCALSNASRSTGRASAHEHYAVAYAACSRSRSSAKRRSSKLHMVIEKAPSSSSSSASSTQTESAVQQRSQSSSEHEAQTHDSQRDAAAQEVQQLELGPAMELAFNRAVRGDAAILRQLLSSTCTWKGPVGTFSSCTEIETELRELGLFLSDPRYTITSTDTSSDGSSLTVHWIASATWPTPWLPRLLIRGKTSVAVDAGLVVGLIDEWQEGLLPSLIRHITPGFWDIWNQFCSPQSERYPYKVLRRGKGYEVRELAPRLVLKPSIIDRTNSRQARMAYVLPDYTFTASINTRGRAPEQYFTTSPLESQITPLIESKTITNEQGETESVQARANRITWTVQVPAAFGLDANKLPDLAVCEGLDTSSGDSIEYERQDGRIIAVTSYNGSVQDKEAGEVRVKLLKQLEQDKSSVKYGTDGRPCAGFLSYDAKVGFNKKGRLSIALYDARPRILGKGNAVYVELER